MGLDGNPLPPKRELRWKIFAWNYTEVEMEDIKFGFVQRHRPSPNGEG